MAPDGYYTNGIWKQAIPHRHKFFLWLALRGRLDTRDNMTRKNWYPDAGCELCPATESIDHIALHCKHSHWVWDCWELTDIARGSNTISQFVQRVQAGPHGLATDAWPICFAAGLLNLWEDRNDCIFNNKQPGSQKKKKKQATCKKAASKDGSR